MPLLCFQRYESNELVQEQCGKTKQAIQKLTLNGGYAAKTWWNSINWEYALISSSLGNKLPLGTIIKKLSLVRWADRDKSLTTENEDPILAHSKRHQGGRNVHWFIIDLEFGKDKDSIEPSKTGASCVGAWKSEELALDILTAINVLHPKILLAKVQSIFQCMLRLPRVVFRQPMAQDRLNFIFFRVIVEFRSCWWQNVSFTEFNGHGLAAPVLKREPLERWLDEFQGTE
ncbi:hypothetical protein C8J56DRAFT_879753 [Mycena floridula]|nr:hypothetical protein C8J56DRAFT_879753 [Mycena floridula]